MAAPVKLSEDLVPLSDLKTHASEVIRQVNETGRPVVVTRHGRGVAVVLSLEDYEALERAADSAALRAAVLEGEADIRAGRTMSLADARKRLRRK